MERSEDLASEYYSSLDSGTLSASFGRLRRSGRALKALARISLDGALRPHFGDLTAQPLVLQLLAWLPAKRIAKVQWGELLDA